MPRTGDAIYLSSTVYWIYQEWTRDFRRCKKDCQMVISHLKDGALFKWYEKKTKEVKMSAQKMLSGDISASHHIPDNETNLTIPSNLVTMERHSGTANDEYT